MGYRSDIIIAIAKEVRARHLISNEIPACLMNDTSVIKEARESDGAFYFRIEGWKWYDSYQEIRDIEAWFTSMQDEEFGAMRMGEDDNDTETWGQPYDFDICLNRYLSCPIDS
jgi:hypothetical protein